MADAIQWLPQGHTDKADIAVLIVSWNVKELLLKNIEALFVSCGSIQAELIVIDNASRDGTVEAVKSQFPEVKVMANVYNAGFSVANGQGLMVKYARHVLLLNPDMRVETDALQKTVEYLDAHTNVAVVGGCLYAADGTVMKHVRRFPTFVSQLAIMLKLPHLFSGIVNRYLASDFDYAVEQAVDSVRGSYFAIHEKALEALAGLDTRYFIWFEEVDYCKNAISKGWKVMYAPSIRATDFIGKSFGQRTTFWKQKQFTRSMVQYFEKWHPWWQAMILKIVRVAVLVFVWIIDRI